MIPAPVAARVDAYLAAVDALAPGLVDGFYLVGSTALGGFLEGRSDIDFVATARRHPTEPEVDAIRRSHTRTHRREVLRSAPTLRWPLVCNGFLVGTADLARDPSDAAPFFSQTAGRFTVGAAFDCNPVTWHVLATRAITLRGTDAGALGVPAPDGRMRAWVLDNLNTYWRSWAAAVRGRTVAGLRAAVAHLGAPWGVLGTARMHCTVATGEVITKEEAGRYALDVFDAEWHPLVRSAVSYWTGATAALTPARPRRTEVAAFVDTVIESANALSPGGTPPA